MSVLMIGSTGMGGSERQFAGTASALREVGIEIVATDRPTETEFARCEFVHIVNYGRPAEVNEWLARAKQRHGKKVAFSTIYWNPWELLLQYVTYGWATLEHQSRVWNQTKEQFNRPMYSSSDVWLPNAYSEYRWLVEDYEIEKPYKIVRNAVEDDFGEEAELTGRFEGCVLCVGRLELRKNQIKLVEALEDTDDHIVVVGDIIEDHDAGFVEKFWEVANKRGRVTRERSKGRREIAGCMLASAVIAQPSWYETPGLVAIEAMRLGKPMVCSDRGCTKEYFGGHVEYCDPADPESIRDAIDRARRRTPQQLRAAQDHSRKYTWKAAARQTLRGYELLRDD